MWLKDSSIGRKLLMSISGLFLVLFLTFHLSMNVVAIFSEEGYNMICEFLGANWYALVGTLVLVAGFLLHIAYAFYLTFQNRKARGNDRYAVTARPKGVAWASQNMLVLGIIVVLGLALHAYQFWAKMQLVEALSHDPATWALVDGAAANPAMGTLFLHAAFNEVWTPIVYIIGFVALWFHMNHGFWSMFQTAGWNNDTWLPRLKKIACCWTTIVVGLFTIQAVWFTIEAKNDSYLNNQALQEQYFEAYTEMMGEAQESIQAQAMEIQISDASDVEKEAKFMELQAAFDAKMGLIQTAVKTYCKDIPQVKAWIQQEEAQKAMQGLPEELPLEELEEVDTTNVQPQN